MTRSVFVVDHRGAVQADGLLAAAKVVTPDYRLVAEAKEGHEMILLKGNPPSFSVEVVRMGNGVG